MVLTTFKDIKLNVYWHMTECEITVEKLGMLNKRCVVCMWDCGCCIWLIENSYKVH